jgi:photosystem II stability/assembly factor-like uncharacterized protein
MPILGVSTSLGQAALRITRAQAIESSTNRTDTAFVRCLVAVALVAAAVTIVATADGDSATAGMTHVDRVALVPNVIAFRTVEMGFAGTGWASCENPAFGCRPRGTISETMDGGRSWRVLLVTPRPVVAIAFSGSRIWATDDSGAAVVSTNNGVTWRSRRPPKSLPGPCPPGPNLYQANKVFVTPSGRKWALCVYGAGTGNEAKAVFRWQNGRWKRVAWTPFPPKRGYGGISAYGYPVGLAMSDDGFGLLWESRGTLYVTRDGGLDWIALPRVAVPEIDFGQSGAALPHGIGFVVLARGGSTKRRLLMTANAGRTWRLVHRWR